MHAQCATCFMLHFPTDYQSSSNCAIKTCTRQQHCCRCDAAQCRLATCSMQQRKNFFKNNCYIFLQNSHKSQHQPRTWLYLWKANETWIPKMYCPYGNIVNFSHTSLILFTCDSICAIARICHGNSVCLSVCLSHGWISQKQLKLGSRNFHHTVAPSL